MRKTERFYNWLLTWEKTNLLSKSTFKNNYKINKLSIRYILGFCSKLFSSEEVVFGEVLSSLVEKNLCILPIKYIYKSGE